MIGIELDRDAVVAGEFLTGKIRWVGEPDRPAASILAAIEWQTEGVGNRDKGYGRAALMKVPKGRTEGTFPLRLLVPYEGPISFQGELMSVQWKLRVRVDQKGFDEFIATDFWVRPRK